MTEPLFQLADQFSHFGVYDRVDSRTQYYPVQPATDADANALAAVAANPDDWWTDVIQREVRGRLTTAAPQLFIQTYSFRVDTLPVPWPPLPPFQKDLSMRPASLFNPEMLLRIVKRGSRWIALRRDKRDDDLALFDGLPQRLRLQNRDRDKNVTLTLQPGVQVFGPPAVQTVFSGSRGVLLTSPSVHPPLPHLWTVPFGSEWQHWEVGAARSSRCSI